MAAMSYSGPDRREFPRIDVHARVVIYASERQLDCVGFNLSERGILVLPPARSQSGLVMRVNIGIAGLPEWITANAVLVREGEYQGRYAWGIEFTQMTPHSASLLRSTIRRTLRGEPIAPAAAPATAQSVATGVGSGSGGARPAPAAMARHLDRTGPVLPPDSQPLRPTGRATGGHPSIQRADTTGSYGRGRGVRPTAAQEPVKAPEPEPEEEFDPFADLPTTGTSHKDIDEHASREVSLMTTDDDVPALNKDALSKLYKDALSDVDPKKKKKKKGWFS